MPELTGPPRVLCAHADQNGEGAHWRDEGEPCPTPKNGPPPSTQREADFVVFTDEEMAAMPRVRLVPYEGEIDVLD